MLTRNGQRTEASKAHESRTGGIDSRICRDGADDSRDAGDASRSAGS